MKHHVREFHVRRPRRRRAGKKGILFSNPVVAAQIGAAAGSLLVAAYVENPDMFKNAAPLLEKYGRLHEREDTIALLEQGKISLKQLVATLRSGAHEGMGKDTVGAALEQIIAEFKASYGMQEWTREDWLRDKKKGKRS